MFIKRNVNDKASRYQTYKKKIPAVMGTKGDVLIPEKTEATRYVFPNGNPSIMEVPDEFANHLINELPTVFSEASPEDLATFAGTPECLVNFTDEILIEELKSRGYVGMRISRKLEEKKLANELK